MFVGKVDGILVNNAGPGLRRYGFEFWPPCVLWLCGESHVLSKHEVSSAIHGHGHSHCFLVLLQILNETTHAEHFAH